LGSTGRARHLWPPGGGFGVTYPGPRSAAWWRENRRARRSSIRPSGIGPGAGRAPSHPWRLRAVPPGGTTLAGAGGPAAPAPTAAPAAAPAEPTLRPQLRFFGAVSTGLAAILGAGIFAVIAPAAAIAGPSLLLSLGLASFIALCNALSSAQLAAVLPRTGGTFEFGRRMLGPWWGFSAGWMFLVANTVGPGAIGIAFGEYLSGAFPQIPARPAAVLAVLAMTGLNALGIRRSVRLTEAVVVLSLVTLLSAVAIGLPAGHPANLTPFAPGGLVGVLRAAALLFFAYTGYSRIATLVEEVHDPQRTIPRATGVALGVATAVYLLVAAMAILVLGAPRLGQSSFPLAAAMVAAGSAVGVGIVVLGALSTTFNEGLSDLLGVSRVAFAMGRATELPRGLAHLGPGQNPWVAVLAMGALAAGVAAFLPFAVAIAISSLGTLLYYTVTNLSALRLPAESRIFPRGLAVAGLVGCLALVASLVPLQIGVGLGILVVGWGFRLLWLRARAPRADDAPRAKS
jgi:APA family basic amino acid/polyamine antiporter